MAEEIKIVVKEERQGNAVEQEEARLKRLAELQKTIAPAEAKRNELLKNAAAYEAKGLTDAAKSARADAAVFEKDITRAKKEHAAHEAQITRALKEQNALRRAGGGHAGGSMGSARMIGEMLDMTTGTQGWVMRSMMMQRLPHLLSTLMRSPMMLGGAALGAAAAGGMFFLGQKEQDWSLENKLRAERGMDAFGRARGMGVFGSSSGLVSESLGAQQEIAQREGQRAELQRQARYSLLGRGGRALWHQLFHQGPRLLETGRGSRHRGK